MGKNCRDCDNEGVKSFATNVQYQGYIPSFSEFDGDPCVFIEDTTEELYKEVEALKDTLDVSGICEDVDYVTTIQGEVTHREATLAHARAICELFSVSKTRIDDAIFKQVSDCVDWKGLTVLDSCENEVKPANMCEVIQRLVDKIDSLL